jgi:hypothetical protein
VTPWAILLDIIPVLAMALAIVLVPLLADGRPARREDAPSPDHKPISEKARAKSHMQMEIADVHLAKVR